MNKGDLQKLTGLSSVTFAKLSKNEASNAVILEVVDRICEVLQVPIYDVVESIPNPTMAGCGSVPWFFSSTLVNDTEIHAGGDYFWLILFILTYQDNL